MINELLNSQREMKKKLGFLKFNIIYFGILIMITFMYNIIFSYFNINIFFAVPFAFFHHQLFIYFALYKQNLKGEEK